MTGLATTNKAMQAKKMGATPGQERGSAGTSVSVVRVPVAGPAYLRRGTQVFGRRVDSSCIFLLVSLGAASIMTGVVFFTADLQRESGLWEAGLALLVLGVVLLAWFLVLCCSARRAFLALPPAHPDRVRTLRPPVRASPAYHLLPLNQSRVGREEEGGGSTSTLPNTSPLHHSTMPVAARAHTMGHPQSKRGPYSTGVTSGHPQLRRGPGQPMNTLPAGWTGGVMMDQPRGGYPVTHNGSYLDGTVAWDHLRKNNGYSSSQNGQYLDDREYGTHPRGSLASQTTASWYPEDDELNRSYASQIRNSLASPRGSCYLDRSYGTRSSMASHSGSLYLDDSVASNRALPRSYLADSQGYLSGGYVGGPPGRRDVGEDQPPPYHTLTPNT